MNQQTSNQTNQSKASSASAGSSVKTVSPRFRLGPIILICIGIIVLLPQFGIEINWDIFWPIVLIVLGLLMIIARHSFSGWIGAVVVIALILTLGWSLISSSWLRDWGLTAVDWAEVLSDSPGTISRDIDIASETYPDVSEYDLSVQIGSGNYSVVSAKDDAYIVRTSSIYSHDRFAPVLHESYTDEKLLLTFTSQDLGAGVFFQPGSRAEYDIMLTRPALLGSFVFSIGSGVATIQIQDQATSKIDLEVGSGTMDFRIGGVNASAVQMRSRVGSGTLRLNDLGRSNMNEVSATFGSGSVSATIADDMSVDELHLFLSGGSGHASIVLPTDVGYSVVGTVGSGSIRINGEDISSTMQQISESYDTAARRVIIETEVGSGRIDIVTK
ncbi:MAG: LiaF transmembrane domain-containing protein [Patescibacteria group bacterium]